MGNIIINPSLSKSRIVAVLGFFKDNGNVRNILSLNLGRSRLSLWADKFNHV